MSQAAQTLTGIEKAAILFITLGPDLSSKILKLLPESMIEKITFEIANITQVEPLTKDEILTEFVETQRASQYIKEGGLDYARDILTKALGSKKAEEILMNSERLAQKRKPFALARKTDPIQLLKTIVNEHPLADAHLSFLKQFQERCPIGIGKGLHDLNEFFHCIPYIFPERNIMAADHPVKDIFARVKLSPLPQRLCCLCVHHESL